MIKFPLRNPIDSEQLYIPLNFELTEIITASKKIDIKKKISIPLTHGHFEKISVNWKKEEKISSITNGIENLGNTCYLNSVLQVFLNTPFLFYYNKRNKISKIHKCKKVKNNNFCLECMILKFFDSSRKKTLYPTNFVNSLKFINKKFVRGRQQDSHEFYLLVLNSVSDFFKNLFFGKLISRVTCPKKHISDVEEPFLNLSLTIQNSNNIKNCLKKYFEPIRNIKSYHCEKCKKKREISKQYIVKKNPTILVLHLNRFNNFGKKLTKHVNFESEIMFNKKKYSLFGIVDHIGSTIQFGHYVSYIRSGNNIWYRMNDSSVNIVNNNNVRRLKPYMLFYNLIEERKSSFEERRRLRSYSMDRRLSKEVDVEEEFIKGAEKKEEVGVEELDIERIFDLEMFKKKKEEIENREKKQRENDLEEEEINKGEMDIEDDSGIKNGVIIDKGLEEEKDENNEKNKSDFNQEKSKKNKLDFNQDKVLNQIELLRQDTYNNSNISKEDNFEAELYIKKKNDIHKEKSEFFNIANHNDKKLDVKKLKKNNLTNGKMRSIKRTKRIKKLKFSKRFQKLKKMVSLNKYFKNKKTFMKLDQENLKEKEMYNNYLEIQKEDPRNFGTVQKRKDSYDVEYDLGKVKKIKKKQIKQRLDFFKGYKKKFNK